MTKNISGKRTQIPKQKIYKKGYAVLLTHLGEMLGRKSWRGTVKEAVEIGFHFLFKLNFHKRNQKRRKRRWEEDVKAFRGRGGNDKSIIV